MKAIRATDGLVLTVTEAAILASQKALAHQGLFVEPTSAVPVAALQELLPLTAPNHTVVVPLTGSGLKGSPLATDSVQLAEKSNIQEY
jgi:threonine synthase